MVVLGLFYKAEAKSYTNLVSREVKNLLERCVVYFMDSEFRSDIVDQNCLR